MLILLLPPTAQYTQSSISTQRGRGRGRTSRGRGHYSDHGSSPQLIQEPTLEIHHLPLIFLELFVIIVKVRVPLHVFVRHPGLRTGTRVSGHPSSKLARTSSLAAQNWLMDSCTTHRRTSDIDNLAIHS